MRSNKTSELVRAALPRRVCVGGRWHLVAPPSVLTVLTLASLAGERDGDDEALWWETLGAWLPAELVESIQADTYGEATMGILDSLVFDGCPMPRTAVLKLLGSKRSSEQEASSPLAALATFDAAESVARVAEAFGQTPGVVLDGSWPLFLLWLREVPRLQAQADLRMLTLRSLPYVKDERERDGIVKRLQTLAGAHDAEAEKTPEQRMEDVRRNREALRRLMGAPMPEASGDHQARP